MKCDPNPDSRLFEVDSNSDSYSDHKNLKKMEMDSDLDSKWMDFDSNSKCPDSLNGSDNIYCRVPEGRGLH